MLSNTDNKIYLVWK